MEEILLYAGELDINEMALSDLKDLDLEGGDVDTIAATYVKRAKERGMEDSKIVFGVGPTLRHTAIPEERKNAIKEAIRKHLGVEKKTKVKKVKKVTPKEKPAAEEDEY